MRRPIVVVAVFYGIWVSLNSIVAIFNIGDGGVSSHLVLLFTGFPLALLSLGLSHATLQAVLLAGALGLLQWCAVASVLSSRSERRAGSDGV